MNQAQIAGLTRGLAQLILGLLVAHGIGVKDSNGTEATLEIIIGGVLSAGLQWWQHRSNTAPAMLAGAIQASQGAITATTSPMSSDTTITIKKPADVPAAVVATVQPKTP